MTNSVTSLQASVGVVLMLLVETVAGMVGFGNNKLM